MLKIWGVLIKNEYTKNDVDVDIIICRNLSQIFLFTFEEEEVEGKKNIYIRDIPIKQKE